MNRSEILLSCVGSVPPLPYLPVIDISSPDDARRFPRWHRYLLHIYGNSTTSVIDLNTFTWFYWSAPLSVTSLKLVDCEDDHVIADGTPWTGGLDGWTWGPEHLTRRLGFFVWRPRPKVYRLPMQVTIPLSSPVEVMRVDVQFAHGYERVRSYFFHAVGSGIFMNYPFDTHYSCYAWYELIVSHEYDDDFWHLRDYNLADGRRCTLQAPQTGILTCSEINVHLWSGNDPLPCESPSPPPPPSATPPYTQISFPSATFMSIIGCTFFAVAACILLICRWKTRRSRTALLSTPEICLPEIHC
jgi:hypothetical protein